MEKDPARDFYLKFGVSNFQYVVAGAGGHPVWTNSPEYIYSFLGAKGKVNMTIGRGLGGNIEGKHMSGLIKLLKRMQRVMW